MKNFNEFNENNQIVSESSLSRLWSKAKAHDFGMITAFRGAKDCGQGETITKAQNLKRNSVLLAKLRRKGYSVTSIKGSYIENYGSKDAKEVSENSFFVSDMKDGGKLKRDLLKLGEEFEQDSIIYGKKASAGILIGTNKCPNGYPGYHKEAKQGGALFGRDGEFMSRVNGRPFIFSEDSELEVHPDAKYPTEMKGVVEQSNIEVDDI